MIHEGDKYNNVLRFKHVQSMKCNIIVHLRQVKPRPLVAASASINRSDENHGKFNAL